METIARQDEEVKPTRRIPRPAPPPPAGHARWPQVLRIVGTPATGCDLLEWPDSRQERGRYIVRRYDDHRVTDHYTTESLNDAETLFWHLATPLPDLADLSDDRNGAFGTGGRPDE